MADTIQDIARQVDENGGVLSISMGSLREAYGKGRLGKHVLAAIQKELASNGLGHTPAELPSYQEVEVRVFRLGSPVHDVIKAAAEPGARNDQRLREAANAEHARIIDQIREIVCE